MDMILLLLLSYPGPGVTSLRALIDRARVQQTSRVKYQQRRGRPGLARAFETMLRVV